MNLMALQPEDLIVHLIKRVRQELDRTLLALPVRLTRLQFGVLYALRSLDTRAATITELAHLSCVEPPTLVAAVHQLEQKKLVTKVRDRTDRRRLPIRLTPQGLRLLGAIPHPASPLLKTVRQKAGAKKMKIFIEVLTLFTQDTRD